MHVSTRYRYLHDYVCYLNAAMVDIQLSHLILPAIISSIIIGIKGRRKDFSCTWKEKR